MRERLFDEDEREGPFPRVTYPAASFHTLTVSSVQKTKSNDLWHCAKFQCQNPSHCCENFWRWCVQWEKFIFFHLKERKLVYFPDQVPYNSDEARFRRKVRNLTCYKKVYFRDVLCPNALIQTIKVCSDFMLATSFKLLFDAVFIQEKFLWHRIRFRRR